MPFAPSTTGNWRTDLESEGLHSYSQETFLVDFWLGASDIFWIPLL